MQFQYLKYDLYRYFYPDNTVSKISLLRKVKIIILNQGIWAIVVYRFARWVNYECRSALLRKILMPIEVLLGLLIEILTGIKIWTNADIGPGLYIGHFGGIFVRAAKLGKFCNISQGVTFGLAGRGDNRGVPEVGDFVYVAPGAKVVGNIKLGDHVAIGANAVVTKDVPDNAVAAGVPAKVISYDSSKDFVSFNTEKYKDIL